VECVWTPGKVILTLTKAFWCFFEYGVPFCPCSSMFHLFHFKLCAPEWSPSREVDAPLLLPSGLMLSRRKRSEKIGEVPSCTNVSLASIGCQVNKDQYTHKGCLVWNSALHPSKAQMPVLKRLFDQFPVQVVRNWPRWMNVFNIDRLTSRATKWTSKITRSKTRYVRWIVKNKA